MQHIEAPKLEAPRSVRPALWSNLATLLAVVPVLWAADLVEDAAVLPGDAWAILVPAIFVASLGHGAWLARKALPAWGARLVFAIDCLAIGAVCLLAAALVIMVM